MTYILVNGKMEKKMDKAHIYSTQQEWNSLDLSEQDKLSMANGCIQTAHYSKGILKIIFRKVQAYGIFKMETQLKEFTTKQKESIPSLQIRLNFHGKLPLTSLNIKNE